MSLLSNYNYIQSISIIHLWESFHNWINCLWLGRMFRLGEHWLCVIRGNPHQHHIRIYGCDIRIEFLCTFLRSLYTSITMAQQVLWDYRMIKLIWTFSRQHIISINWVLLYMDFYSITQKINLIFYIINGIPHLQIKSYGLTLIWIIDGLIL